MADEELTEELDNLAKKNIKKKSIIEDSKTAMESITKSNVSSSSVSNESNINTQSNKPQKKQSQISNESNVNTQSNELQETQTQTSNESKKEAQSDETSQEYSQASKEKKIRIRPPRKPTVSYEYEEQERENQEFGERLQKAPSLAEYQAINKERAEKRKTRLKNAKSNAAKEAYQNQKEQERENQEFGERLQKAPSLAEYQAINKERAEKRKTRLKNAKSNAAKEAYQNQKLEGQTYDERQSIIPSALPTSNPSSLVSSIDEMNKTRFGIKYVPKDRIEANKEYVWIPTANEFAEYEAQKQIQIENSVTRNKEIVTMEQLKYLYSPSNTGFVKEKKSTNYSTPITPIYVNNRGILTEKTQIRVTRRIRLHDKVYTLEGYSHVSKGNLDVDRARYEANLRIRAKIVYATQLIRDGYSEEDAWRIAEESPPVDEITTDTPIPQDVEIEEETTEDQLNWVTS